MEICMEAPSLSNVETRFRQAQRIIDENVARNGSRQGTIRGALRAAKERHPLVLRYLENAAEATGKLAEDQFGRTRRDMGRTAGERAETFVSSAFREAYTAVVDRGEPVEPLAAYYLTAALMAGVVTP